MIHLAGHNDASFCITNSKFLRYYAHEATLTLSELT